MEFSVGDRIIRKSSQESGFVHETRKARTLMIEVRWESTGIKQWLPAEEFKAWDKATSPPVVQKTGWGNTTPAYLVELRRQQWKKPDRMQAKVLDRRIKRLTETLLNLSDKKKSKTKRKAKKLIAAFENTAQFGNKKDERTSYALVEKRELNERIDRDKD